MPEFTYRLALRKILLGPDKKTTLYKSNKDLDLTWGTWAEVTPLTSIKYTESKFKFNEENKLHKPNFQFWNPGHHQEGEAVPQTLQGDSSRHNEYGPQQEPP